MIQKIFLISVKYIFGALLLLYFSAENVSAVSAIDSTSYSSESSLSTVHVVKSASALQYFDGKKLILKNKKQYALGGVKVFDMIANRKNKKNMANIKIAEMTFVNNRLTEVVITLK